jgi:hypothetical protein
MYILERLEALHEMIEEAEMLEEGMTNQASITDKKYGSGHKVNKAKRKKGYVLVQRGGARVQVPAIGFWVHPSGGSAEPVFVAVKKKAGALSKDELKSGGTYDRNAGGRTSGGGGKMSIKALKGMGGSRDGLDVSKADPQRKTGAKSGWKTRVRNMRKGTDANVHGEKTGIQHKGYGRGEQGRSLGTATRKGTKRFKARAKADRRAARG